MGANTRDAIARASTRCSAPLRRDRRIVFPLRPADDGSRRQRAVRSWLIRRPGELNESRSFASPPHGRFAFSFKQTVPNRSTPKQRILRELRQRCDSKLCVSCVLTLWGHASRFRTRACGERARPLPLALPSPGLPVEGGPFPAAVRSPLGLLLASQFFGRHDHVNEGSGSEHGQCQCLADGVADHEPLQRLGVRDGLAVGADQEVVLA